MKKLTQKQIEMLDAIHAGYFQGNVPTVYELADRFHIKTSTIFAHLRALQRKGKLTRTGKARSLEPFGIRRILGMADQQIAMSVIVRDGQNIEPVIQLMRRLGYTVIDADGGVWQKTEESEIVRSREQLIEADILKRKYCAKCGQLMTDEEKQCPNCRRMKFLKCPDYDAEERSRSIAAMLGECRSGKGNE